MENLKTIDINMLGHEAKDGCWTVRSYTNNAKPAELKEPHYKANVSKWHLGKRAKPLDRKTKQRISEIINLREQGLTFLKIAECLSLAESTVNYYWSKRDHWSMK